MRNACKTHASGILKSAVTACHHWDGRDLPQERFSGFFSGCLKTVLPGGGQLYLLLVSKSSINPKVGSRPQAHMAACFGWEAAPLSAFVGSSTLKCTGTALPHLPLSAGLLQVLQSQTAAASSLRDSAAWAPFPSCILVLTQIFSASNLDCILRRTEIKLWNY